MGKRKNLLYFLQVLGYLILFTAFCGAAAIFAVFAGDKNGAHGFGILLRFSGKDPCAEDASVLFENGDGLQSAAKSGGYVYRVVVDPGHGGPDGGADGVRGENEKTLNLSVAKKTASFLKLHGVDVVMTRENDVWLADEDAKHKKHSDVENRVKIGASSGADAFVSIHMNSYPLESCSGLQVFYGKKDGKSGVLAEKITSLVREKLQPGNRRIPKEDPGIYVLENAAGTAVLVECGFISNYDEAALLNDAAYQDKLAFVIAEAVFSFFTEGRQQAIGSHE